jgi:uncharacterized membrane protein YagU involved in acid resistance
MTINRLPWLTIGRAVATGIYGKASFKMGDSVGWQGVGLHFAMSILIAATYVLAAERIAALRQNVLIFGLLYGVGIFVVMNYVVRPLSKAGVSHYTSPTIFLENLVAMLIFGVFVAYADRWFAPAPIKPTVH